MQATGHILLGSSCYIEQLLEDEEQVEKSLALPQEGRIRQLQSMLLGKITYWMWIRADKGGTSCPLLVLGHIIEGHRWHCWSLLYVWVSCALSGHFRRFHSPPVAFLFCYIVTFNTSYSHYCFFFSCADESIKLTLIFIFPVPQSLFVYVQQFYNWADSICPVWAH